MTYLTTKTRKVNFPKARSAAYEVLLEHKITDFPIDLIALIKSYPDIKLISYSEMARRRKISLDEVQLINSSPDGSIHYDARREKYMICYNDHVLLKERVYWTLAHEFGHYILEHHKESDRSSLQRTDMADDEYELFEIEADFFARFLLNPPSIIRQLEHVTYSRIMEFFKVSYKAANNTISYLTRIAQNGWTVVPPDELKVQLEHFIDKVNIGRSCPHCNSFFVLSDAQYCPVCGSEDITNLFKGVEIDMMYSGQNVDERGKAYVCPRCENEEFMLDGDYCAQCGVILVNKCTQTEYSYDNTYNYVCLDQLPGNSRYCHQCGSPSTFLQNGHLRSWDAEKQYEELPEGSPVYDF